MRKLLVIIFAASSFLGAATQTITGTVTDSMCGKDHSSMKMGDDAKCTAACVKAGAKYVVWDGKKVWTLSDQTAPAKFAGKKVTVTGDVTGDAIKVTKIEAAQ